MLECTIKLLFSISIKNFIQAVGEFVLRKILKTIHWLFLIGEIFIRKIWANDLLCLQTKKELKMFKRNRKIRSHSDLSALNTLIPEWNKKMNWIFYLIKKIFVLFSLFFRLLEIL